MENRLREQPGHRVTLTDVADRIEVVEIHRVYQALMRLGDTGADWMEVIFPRRSAGAKLLQRCRQVAGDVVVPAVVASLHYDDVVSGGGSAREPDGLGSGFAAGVEESGLVSPGDIRADSLGEAPLRLARPRAKQIGALRQCARHGGADGGVLVAEDLRREGRVVVNVLVSVRIPYAGALPFDERDVGARVPVS